MCMLYLSSSSAKMSCSKDMVLQDPGSWKETDKLKDT